MTAEIDVMFRQATIDDLPALIALFADDPLGGHGDTTDSSALPLYESAFAAIEASSNDLLFAGVLQNEVVATAQVTFITSLTGRGTKRMAIEAVQTRADMRGKGIGAKLIQHCLDVARAGHCSRATDIERQAPGRAPFLRAAWFREEPRGIQNALGSSVNLTLAIGQ